MISFLVDWFYHSIVLYLALVFAIFYYYSTSSYDKWQKLNVPYMQPVPFFGNIFKLTIGLEHPKDAFDRIYKRFSDEKLCGFFQMKTPFLMIRDPELINKILIKDFSYFTDHAIEADPSLNIMASSLFFLKGQRWRTMRQKLSPGFTSGKLKHAHDQIKECSGELMRNINEKLRETDRIDVREIAGNYSTDVIGTCAFGLKLNTIKNDSSDFRKYGKQIVQSNFRQLLVHILESVSPKLMKILRLQSFPRKAADFYRSVISDVIKYRSDNNVVRNDVTQVIMQARKELVLNNDSESKTILLCLCLCLLY